MRIEPGKMKMTENDLIAPVIMSGGAGTRLWPVSRRARPKQFHRSLSGESLFQATLRRVSPDLGPFASPVVLANVGHEALVRKELAEVGVEGATLILEPEARNTAPAIAAMAAAIAQDAPERIVVVLPADHAVADPAAFAKALSAGAPAAKEGRIVTFGVTPDRPETGYGYIKSGAARGEGAFDVQAFKEKPDAATAATYLADGGYSWNAGIFMFRVDAMIDELARLSPETLAAARKAVENGARADGALRLEPTAFAETPKDSIDYAVMEKTDRAAVRPIDVGWSDVGSWRAVWELAEKDAAGNADQTGQAILLDCADTLTVSDGPRIAALGLKGVAIIATADGVLVIPKDRAQDVKQIVEMLKAAGDTELL